MIVARGAHYADLRLSIFQAKLMTGRGGAGNTAVNFSSAIKAETHPLAAAALSTHQATADAYEREVIRRNEEARRAVSVAFTLPLLRPRTPSQHANSISE